MTIENIRQELNGIADLLEKKNADYGNAYAESCALFKDYPQSKIYEKTKRIIQLSGNVNRVDDERLEDALRDCIGYCALYLDQLTMSKGVIAAEAVVNTDEEINRLGIAPHHIKQFEPTEF